MLAGLARPVPGRAHSFTSAAQRTVILKAGVQNTTARLLVPSLPGLMPGFGLFEVFLL